jgi:hypothetical protein
VNSDHDSNAFHLEWLVTQCTRIPNTFFGLLVLRDAYDSEYRSVAAWPKEDASLEASQEIVERVISERSGLITSLQSSDTDVGRGTAYLLSLPVMADNQIVAVATLGIEGGNKEALKNAMTQLEWGCGWLESMHWRTQARERTIHGDRTAACVDLLAKVMAERSYAAAATRAVSELALLFDCERVSIGLSRRKSIRLNHLSHSAQINKKMNLVRCIEAAMDEAVDQKEPVVLPVTDGVADQISRAHEELRELQKSISVMTVPLYVDMTLFGAITLERSNGLPLSSDEVQTCEAVTALAAGLLSEKKLNDRHILTKIWQSLNHQLAKLFGTAHYVYKILVLSVLIAIFLFSTYKTEYRLSADAIIETKVRRTLVAPFDGYIDQALVRVGDIVEVGQEIAALYAKDLHLEKLKWLSQIERLNGQYQESVSKRDRAGGKVISARRDQAKAQLQLVEMKLERAKIYSPFNGQVIKGDLSNRLGGAVERGDMLFEVAPLHSYRVKLYVSQSRIAEVFGGQKGYLHLLALPGTVHDFTITKLTPVTQSRDGQSNYEVEANLHTQTNQLQLGMEGVAKITIGSRLLSSILLRDLIDWLRIQWWTMAG